MPGTKNFSAAHARRLRAAQPPSSTLPPALLEALDRFQPQGPLVRQWARLKPTVGQILAAADVHGSDSFRKHLTHVGYFLLWADAHGEPPEPAAVIRRLVDEYTRVGMPDSSAKSRADRRARLRRIADKVNPEQAQDPGVAVARTSVKPPYTPRELRQIACVAQTQPTAEQRRKLSACVGLGAGAGLDSADLRHLRYDDVTVTPSGAVHVRVTGQRPRIVVLLREFEALVHRGLEGLQPGALVLGRDELRRNIAARAIGDAVVLGDCPRIEQARLRSTWLARLMSAPLPLAVILAAAGLGTARTLVDLLPYLPSSDCGMALLRDLGSAA